VLRLREQTLRAERLASLTTLAAGAAHELSTPLGTVAVIAGEIEHRAARGAEAQGYVRDARLIRSEVDRCRQILEQMSAESGGTIGESAAEVRLSDLLEDVRAALPPARAEKLAIELPSDRVLHLPRRGLVRVLGSIAGNAFDASPEGTSVTLRARVEAGQLEVEVEDRGTGMSPEVLERAIEPFFTTKPPGRGMGLGLFLVRSFAEQLGGYLSIRSTLGKGTTVLLSIPVEETTAT
jgi:two-component system sensor histidine kinase RegB